MEEKESEKLDRMSKSIEKLAAHFEKATIQDYLKFVGNPWRVLLTNLLAGIMRGFGLAIGLTIIFAVVMIVLTKILSHLITLPYIGQMVAQLVEAVNTHLRASSRIKLDSGGM